jgi:hypothetical protein
MIWALDLLIVGCHWDSPRANIGEAGYVSVTLKAIGRKVFGIHLQMKFEAIVIGEIMSGESKSRTES